jgi:hypothetical protein
MHWKRWKSVVTLPSLLLMHRFQLNHNIKNNCLAKLTSLSDRLIAINWVLSIKVKQICTELYITLRYNTLEGNDYGWCCFLSKLWTRNRIGQKKGEFNFSAFFPAFHFTSRDSDKMFEAGSTIKRGKKAVFLPFQGVTLLPTMLRSLTHFFISTGFWHSYWFERSKKWMKLWVLKTKKMIKPRIWENKTRIYLFWNSFEAAVWRTLILITKLSSTLYCPEDSSKPGHQPLSPNTKQCAKLVIVIPSCIANCL